jgi:hypothetical protein
VHWVALSLLAHTSWARDATHGPLRERRNYAAHRSIRYRPGRARLGGSGQTRHFPFLAFSLFIDTVPNTIPDTILNTIYV